MKCRVDGNIAAEMQAVVNALYIAHRLQLVQAADEVLIQTDCMAAIDAFEGKRRNLPAQEWEAVKVLRRLRSDHSLRVVFRHVKGHTGKKEARFVTNHLCDKRAKEAMRRARARVQLGDAMNQPNYEGKGAIVLDVLDHGFVALRNMSGPNRRPDAPFDADDIDPAQSARMSFDQMDSDRTRDADLKLADYLMRNWHTSPFEMVEIWLEMKMPIFVARQFVRHRTATINEVSGRYVQLPAEWYIPEVVGGKAADKKQGQEDNLSETMQNCFKADLHHDCKRSYEKYKQYLEYGVAPEHARMFLHLNHYTHWLWKQDLHNMLNFLRLRDHSHAQIESQRYAQAVDRLLRQYLPNSMALYDKYRRLEG